MTDTERLDWLSKLEGVNLVSDDNGRWAISDSGIQPAPEEGGFKELVGITSWVEPGEWMPTPRQAIDWAMKHKMWKV